ncbi:MAG TPA: DegT/DnrJ/EryC1/StrS family aminotransferase [Candidatus Nanoarchaeia archaeon]|nr:DegT/DnrJ/EryC1/StrS family aminotransferase [Candidatus Nanoarchaeia archaeon]
MKIPVGIPDFNQEEIDNVSKVMASGWIARGKEVDLFEQQLANYLGIKEVVLVNSGTSALEIALRSLKIEGKEVITTATSCAPTANAIVHSGNIPVMIDISLEDFNLNPDKIEEAITSRTAAIMPVHVYGRTADMEKIMAIAQRHNLIVIEDCAQSMGAKFNGRQTGTFGRVGCFSLNINKIITTGEGGFIATNDHQAAEAARMIRNYGRDPSGSDYCYTHFGHNFKFTNLQAAVGLAQLKKINLLIQARRKKVEFMNNLLKEVEEIILPGERENESAVYFSYTVLLSTPGIRDKLKQFLENKGIEVRTMFRPMCDQPYYQERFGQRVKPLPNAEYVGENGLYVGCYPSLTEEQMIFIANSLKEGLNASRS